MAKFERHLQGDFYSLLSAIEQGIVRGSLSASYEDGSDLRVGEVRCAVRVYERYSMIGQNRVSLSVTLLGEGDQLYLSAIASGGSQAVFLKINTFGEEAFLDSLIGIVQDFESRR